MVVTTRSKSLKIHSGNNVPREPVESVNSKTPPKSSTKKKSRAKKKPSSRVPPLASRSLITKDAESIATKILSRIDEAARIGGSNNSKLLRYYNYHPALVRYLSEYLQRRMSNPKTKLWLFIMSEALLLDLPKNSNDSHANKKIIHHFHLGQKQKNIPVIIAIESEVEPINYMVQFSTETHHKIFSSFEKLNMSWEDMGCYHVLECRYRRNFWNFGERYREPLFLPTSDHALVPLTKPSIVHALPCDSVLSGGMNGQIVVIGNRNERQRFSDMVETLAAKHQQVDNKSTIEASLEAMKVFKIYPDLDKNAMLHPLYGTVDGYF